MIQPDPATVLRTTAFLNELAPAAASDALGAIMDAIIGDLLKRGYPRACAETFALDFARAVNARLRAMNARLRAMNARLRATVERLEGASVH